MRINPLDDDNGGFFDFVNRVLRGLWLAFADVSGGRRVVCGQASRAACLDYIEQNWTYVRPAGLRERLTAGRVFDG